MQNITELRKNIVMNDFVKEIKDFLEGNSDGLARYPQAVQSLINEKDSDWSFTLDVVNGCTSSKTICILPAGIPVDRYLTTDGSKQYAAIGSGIVTTRFASKILNLSDEVSEINRLSGTTVDAVLAQVVHGADATPSLNTQIVYKDGTGEVTCTSKSFSIEIFKTFLQHCAARVFEIQLSSSSSSLFQQRISMREINPFKNGQIEELNIEDYFKPDNKLQTKVIIDRPFYIDGNTFMSLPIPAGASISISFRVGAIFSQKDGLINRTQVENFIKHLSNYIK